jgi:hypothetical protein
MVWKLTLAGLLFLFIAPAAMADVEFGPNVSWSNPSGPPNGDWGAGARLDFGSNVRGIIAFDYFFTNAEDLFSNDVDSSDFDLKFWELNGNIVYAFSTDTGAQPYVGAGIGIARRTFHNIDNVFNDDRTEVGINALGGIKFGAGAVHPFFEARYTWYHADNNDELIDIGADVEFRNRFVVSGGILF